MKSRKKDVSVTVYEKSIDALRESTLAAAVKGSSFLFLQTILTESEQIMLGRRLLIMRMLLSGAPQNEIRLQLRVSPNMVGKINKWLIEQIPEYETVTKKVVSESRARAALRTKPKRQYVDPLSFAALRKKYPLHFLLFNIAEEMIRRRRKN